MTMVPGTSVISAHVTVENAGKTILPENLNNFETKKYLKNLHDSSKM